ncbi:MAG: glycosyltransferase family 4 protein [Longimicrobiales bacterium]
MARTNGVGVDRDVRLLLDAFDSFGERPAFSHYRSISPLRRWVGQRDPRQWILFLERVTARWLRSAGHYLLIPNQERFARRLVPLLSRIDHILCKTRHAQEVFAPLHPSVRYIGFTSVDRRCLDITPDYSRFFHLAGGSFLKGTEVLFEVWSRHPEWPELTVVRHGGEAPVRVPANVNLVRVYVPDEELQSMQNACGVHLCPSRSEGWGHSIVEAMSCGAVTVTTDGPPMNELIQSERGVLVPWRDSEPRKLGVNYSIDPALLESAIADLIGRPASEKAALGTAARHWFEQNDRAFRANLEQVAESILPST